MRVAPAILAVAMFAGVTFAKTEAIAPDWVFVSTPLKWQSAPRKAELHIRTAPATLLVVYPSGRYAAVSCLLIQQRDGAVTISHGDGQVVRNGTWKTVADKLVAKSIVVFRTVSQAGNTEPEVSRTEEFTVKRVKGHRELQELGGQKYVQPPKFVDFEELATWVNTR